MSTCHLLQPAAEFAVTGPGKLDVVVHLALPTDLPKGPVKATVAFDNKARPLLVPVKKAPWIRVAEQATWQWGMASRPQRLVVKAGTHTLRVALPDGLEGCAVLRGLPLQAVASPADTAVSSAPTPPPAAPALPTPPSSPPPAEPAPAHAAAPAMPTEPTVATPATTAPTESAALEMPPLEEIRAKSVDELTTTGASETSGTATKATQDARVRVGGTVAGVLPRANLKTGIAVGLLGEVPLSLVGMPSTLALGALQLELRGYLAFGWAPLRQQDEAMIPGRGLTTLRQTSLVLPLDAGLVAHMQVRNDASAYLRLGAASQIVRTELQAFSTKAVHENDWALGVACAVGAALALGPGDLVAELSYREIGADLGAFGDIAESTLSAAGLQVGYLLRL